MSELRAALHRLATYGIPPNEMVACRLSVALDGFVDFWRHETLPFLAAGGSELRFIEAPYGRGKTHCLHVLARTARDAGFAVAVVQCSAESKPFESPSHTYGSIVRTLKFPVGSPENDGTGSGSEGLLPFLVSLSVDQRSTLRRTNSLNTGFRNLLSSYASSTSKPFPNRAVQDGLADLINPEPGNATKISELYRYDHTLARPLSKLGKRTSVAWIHGLLRLPRILGLRGVVILFDETGADLHLAREGLSRKRTHLAQLRNLIDHLGVGNLPGVAVVYAAASDLATTAREVLPPLAQRIERTDPTQRNLRAVWGTLDEITDPRPGDRRFYQELCDRVVALAKDAGFREELLRNAQDAVRAQIPQFAQSIRTSSVREFIKFAASTLIAS